MDSGSIFVQIGDEKRPPCSLANDEVFGEGNAVALCAMRETTGFSEGVVICN